MQPKKFWKIRKKPIHLVKTTLHTMRVVWVKKQMETKMHNKHNKKKKK